MTMSEANDDQLLASWRAGDRVAGELLFQRHWRNVTRFLVSKVGPECEDLVQQTFLACVEGQHRYRGESCFQAYLIGIARYTLLRHLRSRRSSPADFDPDTTSLAALGRSHTSMLSVQRKQARVTEALQELPLDTQIVLELHYWQGLKLREIAEVVEQPVNTVKARIRRGRLALAERLQTQP